MKFWINKELKAGLVNIIPEIIILSIVAIVLCVAIFPSKFKNTIADIRVKGYELATNSEVNLIPSGNSELKYSGGYTSHVLSENIVPIPDSKLTYELKYEDLRVRALEKYLRETRNSPTADYAYLYVYYADKYRVPWILMPSIGEAETHSCTHGSTSSKIAPSARQKNCWGIGGSPKNRITYNTWEQSIESAVRLISEGYGQDSISMMRIQRKYCGPGCIGDIWARRVMHYVDKINLYADQVGAPRDNNVTL